jgi:hypothetical protein
MTTHIDNRKKTYSVTPFADLAGKAAPAGMDVKIDVQETGQHKTILGFNCREVTSGSQASPCGRRSGAAAAGARRPAPTCGGRSLPSTAFRSFRP